MDYRDGEKTEAGYLALPSAGAGPGVLVLHAWWGLNDFFTGLCDRLAREGFVALAPDLYGGAVARTVPEAQARVDALDPAATEATVLQALDVLRRHPAARGDRVGLLGCSLGGWWALRLSTLRPEEVAACVLFYGVGEADFARARCAYLGHFAEEDAFDPPAQARAMAAAVRAAGRDVTVYEYPGAGHWFFEEDRPDAYRADAARLAWDRTVAFLHTHLRPGQGQTGP